MSPDTLRAIVRIAAEQRYLLHYAGMAPWQRPEFVEEEWARVEECEEEDG